MIGLECSSFMYALAYQLCLLHFIERLALGALVSIRQVRRAKPLETQQEQKIDSHGWLMGQVLFDLIISPRW